MALEDVSDPAIIASSPERFLELLLRVYCKKYIRTITHNLGDRRLGGTNVVFIDLLK